MLARSGARCLIKPPNAHHSTLRATRPSSSPSSLIVTVKNKRHLVNEGLVDEKRLCIDGGSAGGYTTLAALAFR